MSTTASAPDSPDPSPRIVPFPAFSVPLSRRRLSAASRVHSRAVRLLRTVLPLAASALVAALVLWPQEQSAPQHALLLNATAADSLAAGPHMLNPRLVSVGADQKPLRIRAASALQPEGPQGRILLESPQAELILTSGDTATIAAGSATFFPNRPQDILLQGGIRFLDASGNTLSGKNLTVDTARQMAFSREPVEARFPSGTVKADGITISDGGASIRFQGRTTSQVTVGNSTAAAD